MNERIKELEDQCWVKVPCDFDMNAGGLSTIRTVFDRKKFAELLIRECLDCIAKVHKTEYTKEFNEGYTLGVERCFYKIEEHFFGVEE